MKILKGTIDRFEEDFVVVELEDGTMMNIRKDLLPFELKEGTVIIIDGDNIRIDELEADRKSVV